jgi:hypothetical protein
MYIIYILGNSSLLRRAQLEAPTDITLNRSKVDYNVRFLRKLKNQILFYEK